LYQKYKITRLLNGVTFCKLYEAIHLYKNKKVAINVELLVKAAKNMRFLLLSATPMYNSYKEIERQVGQPSSSSAAAASSEKASSVSVFDIFKKGGKQSHKKQKKQQKKQTRKTGGKRSTRKLQKKNHKKRSGHTKKQ
jgi:hypothetical protein